MKAESPGDAVAVGAGLDALVVDPVTNHRFDALIEAGYARTAAAAIAVSRAIDLHEAVDLIKVKGCDPKLAADILL